MPRFERGKKLKGKDSGWILLFTAVAMGDSAGFASAAVINKSIYWLIACFLARSVGYAAIAQGKKGKIPLNYTV